MLIFDKRKQKVRPVVICFGLYLSLVLFQTPFMNLGTLAAFGTIALTVLSALFCGDVKIRSFRLTTPSILLTLLFLLSTVVSFASGGLPNYYVRYAAQFFLCVFLINVRLTPHEHNFLKQIFCVALTIYAALAIQSMAETYTHARIKLFGSSLDPNFIGLPMVGATCLFLERILCAKKGRILAGICYVICAAALLMTASRGNLVGWIGANGVFLILYIFRSRIPVYRKAILIGLLAIAIPVLIGYAYTHFDTQLQRMLNFGEGADNGRFDLWEKSFAMWKNAPIFGNGLNAMIRSHSLASHNTYLQLLTETGLVGLVLMGVTAFIFLKKAWKYEYALLCMLVGMLMQIFFLDALDNRYVWILLTWAAMFPAEKGLMTGNR